MAPPPKDLFNKDGKPKRHYLGPEHVFDFPSLIIDNPVASKHTVNLVDLDVTVYGLDEIHASTLPIGAIILSHGRCNSAKNMEPMASGLLGEIRKLEVAGGRKKTRDVIVVTLDHRNHGERTKYRNVNLSYDKNPLHLIDMAATVYAGAQDHGFIIDFLPAYLFPRGERTIAEFMAVGVSMGGHTVWRLLREDPRIQIGIPLISVPSEVLALNLIERHEQYGLKDKLIYPPGVRSYMEARPPPGVYTNKKILSIHGELDFLMPIERCRPMLDQLVEESYPGYVDVFVCPDSGHKVSPEMVRRCAEWCWRWGLSIE